MAGIWESLKKWYKADLIAQSKRLRDFELSELLFNAIEKGDSDEVTRLIVEEKAPVSIIDPDKISPLSYAITYNKIAIAIILLDNGADKEERDCIKETAIFKAVAQANLEATKLLIERGAKVNIRLPMVRGLTLHPMSTPLDMAVLGNNMEIALALLEAGARFDFFNKSALTRTKRTAEQNARLQNVFEKAPDRQYLVRASSSVPDSSETLLRPHERGEETPPAQLLRVPPEVNGAPIEQSQGDATEKKPLPDGQNASPAPLIGGVQPSPPTYGERLTPDAQNPEQQPQSQGRDL
jgi:hypothetical protein